MFLKKPYILVHGLSLFLIAWQGFAFDVPNSSILSLTQTGQDIEVELHCWDKSSPPFDVYLERTDEAGVVTPIESPPVELDDIVAHAEPHCDAAWESIEICEKNPASCQDCDEDGVLECQGDNCYKGYRFVVIDECVPPGTWTYSIDPSTKAVDVQDIEYPCPDEDTGCSVAPLPGKPTINGLLAFFDIIVYLLL